MALISVVIPAYNRKETLKDAIESILLQTIKQPSEIIVINDGSFFNMSSYLKAYSSFIKIINLPCNFGVSAARNKGIKESSGKYIAFLDSDDIFLPKKLEYQINFMQEHNFLISHTNEFWYRQNKWVNKTKNNQGFGGSILPKILDKCRISPSSLIVEKSVFEKTGLFNEKLQVCEDYDISLRMALHYNIGYINKKLIIKRAVTDNSLSASIKHIEYIRYNILQDFYKTYKKYIKIEDINSIKKEINRKKCIIESGLSKNRAVTKGLQE